VAGALEYEQKVLAEGDARLLEVHVREAAVVRTASCDHHVVDRFRQLTEEPLERSRIGGVEGRGAQRVELERGVLQARGVPAGWAGCVPSNSTSGCATDASLLASAHPGSPCP
jgi:hypothetical protein